MKLDDLEMPEDIEIDEGSFRVVKEGYVADHEGELLFTGHLYDGFPMKFSQGFFEERALRKGDKCAVVEYTYNDDYTIDLWKIKKR